ncbi:MAG: hypothetical protein VYA84_02800 [Planctomycetota bacterium]|nr:hypothetical protein [Planctomycetota bacterium]
MLLNRGQTKLHLVSGVSAALLTIVCIAYYAEECREAGRLVGGGSASGLLCGIFAGLVIVFEMLLWPRKALRRLRLFPTKYWLTAHIWFGIAALPLAIVHSGFHLGGWLPMTFLVLFVLTIVSGLYGLAVQKILPRWMLRNLPAETIYSQIDYVSEQAVEDVRQLLVTACGRPASASNIDLVEEPQVDLVKAQSVVVGAVRQAGKTRGRTLQTRRVADAEVDREALWSAFEEIRPFLLVGAASQTPVTDPQYASRWFRRLRGVTGRESETIIDTLQELCDQRRQFDTQRTVHRWLHGWLPVHIGLSIAVTILLAAHIWTALKYW